MSEELEAVYTSFLNNQVGVSHCVLCTVGPLVCLTALRTSCSFKPHKLKWARCVQIIYSFSHSINTCTCGCPATAVFL